MGVVCLVHQPGVDQRLDLVPIGRGKDVGLRAFLDLHAQGLRGAEVQDDVDAGM